MRKDTRAQRRRLQRQERKIEKSAFSLQVVLFPIASVFSPFITLITKSGFALRQIWIKTFQISRHLWSGIWRKLCSIRIAKRKKKGGIAVIHDRILYGVGISFKGSAKKPFRLPVIFTKPKTLSLAQVLHILSILFWIVLESAIIAGLTVFLWKLHDPLLFKPLNLYDEGVTLMGAKRFAAGDIPYRDFFTIYGPLKFSLLGFIFQQFGTNLFVARLFFLGVSLVGYLCLYLFLRRETNMFYAALFSLCVIPFGDLSLAPLLFILIAWWFSAQTRTPQSTYLPFFGGFFIGLLFLLRLDFGGFSGLAVFLLLILWTVFDKRVSFNDFAVIIGKAGAAFTLTVLPFFLTLSLQGALRDYWEQAIYFPLFGTYQELRHLPWTEITSLKESVNGFTVDLLQLSGHFVWFFWPLPFVIAALYWLLRAIKNDFDLPAFTTNLLMGAFTIAALLYTSHRSDMGHVLFLNLISLLFLLHLLTLFKNRLVSLLYLPLILLVLLYPAIDLKKSIQAVADSPKKTYSFFPYAFPATSENDELEQTLDFFDHVPPNKKVYVGISDTSRVFVNNVMLPFLLDQPTVTRYHELHTGIVTTAPVQMEMLDELKDTEYVVLWDLFFCEPNLGCLSTKVHLVDEHIARHFTKVAEFGKYKILQKNFPAPAVASLPEK